MDEGSGQGNCGSRIVFIDSLVGDLHQHPDGSSGILIWEILKRDFRGAFSFNKKLLLQSIGARAFELLGLWRLFCVFC
ncbi:hypothetical protein TorRG33x02_230540 [Trema orientale]|uniref:Uncharacterized protein n=1 Tax=Trema orientale TaxID=63057 RepID=A0A2P5E6R6_TREOI|nr:hypothetical protein TorRG33x02_230540 [Trema orientale]